MIALTLFLLTSTGWASPWTQRGDLWQHPQGVSIRPPKGARVETTSKTNSIEISGAAGDDYFIGGQILHSESEAEARLSELKADLAEAKPQWGKEQSESTAEFDLFGQHGSGTINGNPTELSIGYLFKNGKYFVFMYVYSGRDKERLDNLISDALLTVRFR